MTDSPKPENIDAYIAGFPAEIQSILERIRSTIREVAPEAKETISYRMPAFTLGGVLVYFAAFKHHIGIYPPLKSDEKLIRELASYSGPKGNLKFPLDEPIPYPLIRRVVKARQEELRETARSKRRKR